MTQIEYGDAVYCSVDDVARRFRKDGAFDFDSNPTDAQVLEFIREATDRIDSYTYHAWRENQVIEEERRFDGQYKWGAGRGVRLERRPIRTPMDDAKGDELGIWTGNGFQEWVSDSSKQEGRDNHYWFEADTGMLWVYKRFLWWSGPQLRVTYRYGEDVPTTTEELADGTEYEVIERPRDVKRAASMLTSVELYRTDTFTQNIPGGEGAISPSETVAGWEDEVFGTGEKKGILDRHKNDPMWVEPL